MGSALVKQLARLPLHKPCETLSIPTLAMTSSLLWKLLVITRWYKAHIPLASMIPIFSRQKLPFMGKKSIVPPELDGTDARRARNKDRSWQDVRTIGTACQIG